MIFRCNTRYTRYEASNCVRQQPRLLPNTFTGSTTFKLLTEVGNKSYARGSASGFNYLLEANFKREAELLLEVLTNIRDVREPQHLTAGTGPEVTATARTPVTETIDVKPNVPITVGEQALREVELPWAGAHTHSPCDRA